MWCPGCNYKAPDQARFCSRCGERLVADDIQPRQERRHVTVVFCDLVGSTELSARLDPEDYRDILSSYRDLLTHIIKNHSGYAGRFLGDGLLAYFGYPRAEEGDAIRAARAALDICQQVPGLNGPGGEKLGVRLGIATGLVLAGDVIGEGVDQELTVSGDVPNLAARLQGLAATNQILMTLDTRRLLADHFAFESIGLTSLKGMSEPVEVVRLLAEKQIESRFLAERGGDVGSLIGRSREFAQLWNAHRLASEGVGQLVVLSGEAGIGKSRLVHELLQSDTNAPTIVLQCSSHQTNAVLYPVLERLNKQLQLPNGSDAGEKRRAIDALLDPDGQYTEALPLLHDLMGVGDTSGETHAAAERRSVLEALVAYFRRLAGPVPVLLIVEDAHWIDPTTAELLRALAEQIETTRLLLIVTHRPDITLQWPDGVTRIELEPLPSNQSAMLIAAAMSATVLPQDTMQQILERCDGNPLYLEELSKNLLEQRQQRSNGRDIPDSLQDTLMARLDRLGSAKRYVQVGAMLGRSFQLSVLAGIALVNCDVLAAELDQAVQSEVIIAADDGQRTEYTFRHALIQDAAYASLTRRERREMHALAAAYLKKSSAANQEPHLVAHHLELAGDLAGAAEFWEAAGVQATERSANLEAINYLQNSIELLSSASVEGGKSRELDLRVRMAGALRATKGYAAPQVGEAVEEILTLSRQVGRKDIELNALNGLYSFHLVRSNYGQAGELSRSLLQTAEQAGDTTYEMIGHRAVGIVAFHVGQLREAIAQMQQALDRYNTEEHLYLANIYGSDHAATTGSYLCQALWVAGSTMDAIELQNRTVAHSENIQHAHSIAMSIAYRALLFCLDRNWSNVIADCDEVIRYSQERGLRLMELFGQATLGIARAQQSASDTRMKAMVHGIEVLDTIAPNAMQPCLLTLAASALIENGQMADASTLLDRALQISEKTGEVWASAETARVRSALLFMQGDRYGAEAELDRALAIALDHGANRWQFRIALDRFTRESNADTHRALRQICEQIQYASDNLEIQRAIELLDHWQT